MFSLEPELVNVPLSQAVCPGNHLQLQDEAGPF